ncbi:MAG: cytochrome c [Thermoleophilia bacterium]|nr:cytochrome c [Thermoleophilia bacterium]
MVVSYEIGTNNADDSNAVQPPGQAAEEPAAAPAAVPPPAAAGPGSDLFVASCGSCHTLSAAGTDGAAGPNLDDLQPDAALVASAIEAGGTGSGAMPAGLLSGEDAQDVADYVAASSGASK